MNYRFSCNGHRFCTLAAVMAYSQKIHNQTGKFVDIEEIPQPGLVEVGRNMKHSNITHLEKFFQLRARGKRAALTAHNLTGEVACLYTHNLATGAEGNGTPPQNWTADWRRYAECKDGYITTPEEN